MAKTKEKTKEELNRERYQAEIAKIEARNEELFSIIEDKKYSEMGYKPGQTLEIDSSVFISMSNLLPTINTQINKIYAMSELVNYQLLQLTNLFMETHISNIEAGRSLTKEELDKEDAPKKIVEVPSQKVITEL